MSGLVSIFETVTLEIEVSTSSHRISAVAIDGVDLPMSDRLKRVLLKHIGIEEFKERVSAAHEKMFEVDPLALAKAQAERKMESA